MEVDYYALGVILYRLLEDRFPCQETPEEVVLADDNNLCYQRYMNYVCMPLVKCAHEPLGQQIFDISRNLMQKGERRKDYYR